MNRVAVVKLLDLARERMLSARHALSIYRDDEQAIISSLRNQSKNRKVDTTKTKNKFNKK